MNPKTNLKIKHSEGTEVYPFVFIAVFTVLALLYSLFSWVHVHLALAFAKDHLKSAKRSLKETRKKEGMETSHPKTNLKTL